ncbi:MFS transporter [Streptomyces cocklensis]|uniref:Predicted arabinose efflux permease, MFS family n=1 Tax=Actinacidiphila cocklensis TaxID=887465 RepID=A0A9W4E108_9ACTN|nr:MFS transporter [Actinacidiphila cocklensis]MDD1060839.1 MFS transporter [Actinacidiphila cocklensis]CAG6397491.1 Predicted arabinose efflux permease, MFS family [Actinacidiphila cocklensis]
MATGYADLLRTRHAARLLGGTLLGRLPNAMAALAIVLFLRSQGAGYGLAGTLSAVYGCSVAVGQPLLGRAVDRRGQPRVMAGAALLSATGCALLVATGPDPLPLATAAVVLAGIATPPLEGGLRALWPDVLGREDRVQRAYALDAAAQEVLFALGPLLVTLLVSAASHAAAVVVTGLLGVAGTLVVVTSAPSRRWRAAEREAHWLGALRSVGLAVLLCAFFFVGVALGAISLAAVVYGDAHGGGSVAAYVLAANGVGGLTGGLTYGARNWPGQPERRMRVLSVALAACYPPLILVPGVPWMLLLAVLSGLFLAPTLACGFLVVDRHAPAGTVTEAFSWMVTAVGVGASLGTAAAGVAAQHGGAAAGFAVAGTGAVVATAVLLSTGRFLTASNLETRQEKDPNRAVEPRFSTTHQA